MENNTGHSWNPRDTCKHSLLHKYVNYNPIQSVVSEGKRLWKKTRQQKTDFQVSVQILLLEGKEQDFLANPQEYEAIKKMLEFKLKVKKCHTRTTKQDILATRYVTQALLSALDSCNPTTSLGDKQLWKKTRNDKTNFKLQLFRGKKWNMTSLFLCK